MVVKDISTRADKLKETAIISKENAYSIFNAGIGFAVVADEIRKLAESSKQAVTEIQGVTTNVLDAVEDLVASSQKILSFIQTTVISDYNLQVNNSGQYSDYASNIDNFVREFSSTTKELMESINNILAALGDVTISVNESTQGITNIATQASDVLNKTNDVITLSHNSKNSSVKLIDSVKKLNTN